MTQDANFEEALLAGRGHINSLELERAAIGKFLGAIEASLSDEMQLKYFIHFVLGEYQLGIICNASDELIAQIRFDVLAKQCLYSDFRGIPEYPLPPNPNSIPVAIKYMGLSVAYFQAKHNNPQLPLLGTSISEQRDFFWLQA